MIYLSLGFAIAIIVFGIFEYLSQQDLNDISEITSMEQYRQLENQASIYGAIAMGALTIAAILVLTFVIILVH